MKILFLDVDGVLNDLNWIIKNSPAPSFEATIDDLVKHIDPTKVARINEIVDKTDCQIVLSSSTRVDPKMSVVLAKAGLRHQIYSSTPILLWRTNKDGTEFSKIERADEVLCWLENQVALKHFSLTDKFAILDDQDHGWSEYYFYGLFPLYDKWVQTSFENGGLGDKEKEKVIALLSD